MTPQKRLLGTIEERSKVTTGRRKLLQAENALIHAFDEKLKSWVLDSSVSFHATTNKECIKNYVQESMAKSILETTRLAS